MDTSKFSNGRFLRALLTVLFVLSVRRSSGTIDIITPTQNITDPESLVSAGGFFKLGFFTTGNSTSRYVGIWYNNIPEQTIAWIANRDNPLPDSSGVIRIANDGNLVVVDGQEKIFWSTNISTIAQNSSAKLLDSGNLVLQQGSSTDGDNNGSVLWESFEHPCDTFLPKMKIGTSTKTAEKQLLTSKKGDSDPSTGRFTAGVVPLNIPEVFVWNGSLPHWRSGPWNNRIFLGVPDMYSVYLDGFKMDRDAQDGSAHLTFSYVSLPFLLVRFVLDSEGKLVEYDWGQEKKNWTIGWLAPRTECDIYGKCGAFGSCNALDSPICSCLKGFIPKSVEEWTKGNWSSGCMRRTELQCERNNTSSEKEKTDEFLKLKMMKVPDSANWSAAADANDCEKQCLSNCSCVAYAFDINIGCMSWSGNLIDTQKFSTGGVELHIRLAYSEFGRKHSKAVIITVVIVVGAVTLGVLACCVLRRMAKQRGLRKKGVDGAEVSKEVSDGVLHEDSIITQRGKCTDLPVFEYEDLAIATDKFDLGNKLGKGGFGEVYKGRLPDGQEIAVKKLSKTSGQGLEEFKNEVAVISKLQHRNLVKLLGCCIEGEEKMLVYEYMPNKSLDVILFDPTKRTILDWNKRLRIIEGIGRGLLYLHRDSRLKIIHRDLKASNILLDEELNPKISDFGMAKIIGGTEDEASTRRVVGTYGYMSPEYAMEGRFSEKSDVFSFGVLLLEIVSGRKNGSFYHLQECSSFLGHAWTLWNEGKILELIDPTILCEPPSIEEEVLRCIRVGLLCVQEFPKDRPTVSSIMSMLSSEIADLPTPKQPGFIERLVSSETESFQRNQMICSKNDVTITTLEGR
uniref:Receptor-like serine/threonine-protein kinase n=1 Tax=Nelumbo nucifera TaxID=4432 RepID=A0A822XRT2_NELNU|nr:TPA_asm: hypothetical protein HUJ06_024603 [Nelumbo nucifera]